MRGRILLTTITILGAATLLAACTKRDSLYIEPGKADATPAKKDAAQLPAPPSKTP